MSATVKNPAVPEAIVLHGLGYWSHAIHPGEKRPIGNGWGLKRWDIDRLSRTFKRYPDAGVGICLGPGRGPDGSNLIDVELDGPDGEAALETLFAGEAVETIGWSSARGGHSLFVLTNASYDRLSAALAQFGKEGTGIKVGVWHMPGAPGLEFRIGGLKGNGEPKQVQSVCPPTPGTDGEPRRWRNILREPAAWPESATDRLEEMGRAAAAAAKEKAEAEAKEKAAAEAERKAKACPEADPWAMTTIDRRERARLYLAKVDPAVSGQGGHNQTFKTACKIGPGFDLDPEVAMELMREWSERCDPPWSDAELQHKVDDAYRVEQERGFLLNKPLDATKGAKPRIGQVRRDPEGNIQPNEATDDPHRLARIYREAEGMAGDDPALWFHQDGYKRWNGSCYEDVPPSEIRAEITSAVKDEFDRVNIWQQKQYDPEADKKGLGPPKASKVTASLVANVSQALTGYTVLPSSIEAPAWLGEDPPFPLVEALPARNCIVHLPSLVARKPGAVRDCTPRFFSSWALDYDFDPEAPQPLLWERFLGELWPSDPESTNTLQEWFGYCLTNDTSQQKIGALIGPKRSGKGTVARILRAACGAANVVGPTLSGLSSHFGMAPLIGKPLAIIDDARLSGKADAAIIVERLLTISGEGTLTIDRKHLPAWTGKLPTRLLIQSNELPRLADSSGALAGRLIILRMTESFYGREDPALTEKLLAEMPGILLWAIEGWRRLHERGYFIQPASGRELVEEMEELSSPIGAFLKDRCIIGPGKEVSVADLFEEWKSWCESVGRKHVGDTLTFGRDVRAAIPNLKTVQRRENGRARSYIGIGLDPLRHAVSRVTSHCSA
jgi:putative DNA primase/helicase